MNTQAACILAFRIPNACMEVHPFDYERDFYVETERRVLGYFKGGGGRNQSSRRLDSESQSHTLVAELTSVFM